MYMYVCIYVYVYNIGSTVLCRGMFFRDAVHLLMTITKLRSDAFGPGCHQLATSTAIYASPCRHLNVGSLKKNQNAPRPSEVLVVVRAGVIKLPEYVSPRQTYWLPPKLFTENDKISTSPDRNFAINYSCGPCWSVRVVE